MHFPISRILKHFFFRVTLRKLSGTDLVDASPRNFVERKLNVGDWNDENSNLANTDTDENSQQLIVSWQKKILR